MSLLPSCYPVLAGELGATNGKCECGHPVDTRSRVDTGPHDFLKPKGKVTSDFKKGTDGSELWIGEEVMYCHVFFVAVRTR